MDRLVEHRVLYVDLWALIQKGFQNLNVGVGRSEVQGSDVVVLCALFGD